MGNGTADLSTEQVAAQLSRSGYPTTAGALRQDVLAGLVCPRMPEDHGPGSGHRARWSAMALRRCLYVARLRRIGVDGRVIPLLAFLRDGWGWSRIEPFVARSVRKSWEMDRRSLNRPTRVRQRRDLLDNADTGGTDAGIPWKPLLEVRRYVATSVWFGDPEPGTSTAPFVEELMGILGRDAGVVVGPDEMARGRALSESIAAARRDLGIGAADLPRWLSDLTPMQVERGRLVLVGFLRDLRREGPRIGLEGNPLTLFGQSREAMAADLRRQRGRPTLAQMLASLIAQWMYGAEVLQRAQGSMPDTSLDVK